MLWNKKEHTFTWVNWSALLSAASANNNNGLWISKCIHGSVFYWMQHGSHTWSCISNRFLVSFMCLYSGIKANILLKVHSPNIWDERFIHVPSRHTPLFSTMLPILKRRLFWMALLNKPVTHAVFAIIKTFKLIILDYNKINKIKIVG